MESLAIAEKSGMSKPHRARFFHLFLCGDCAPSHLVDFSPVRLSPYSLFCIGADKVHAYDRLSPYRGRVLLFTESFYGLSPADTLFLQRSPLFSDLYGSPVVPVGEEEMRAFWKMSLDIEQELGRPEDMWQHALLQSRLHTLLLEAERAYARLEPRCEIPQASQELFFAFRSLLEKRYPDSHQASDYSKALGVGPKQLAAATARALGKSPKQCIEDRLLLEAKRLLSQSQEPIKAIGFALGFAEATHFTKFFRLRCGLAPQAFRAQYLEGNH